MKNYKKLYLELKNKKEKLSSVASTETTTIKTKSNKVVDTPKLSAHNHNEENHFKNLATPHGESLFKAFQKTLPRRKPKDIDILIKSEDVLKKFKESWLTISSKRLEDEKIYPSVTLPDFTENWINTGPNSCRINRLYEKEKETNPEYPPTEYSFWFRISSRNFYYNSNSKSLNTLGSIEVSELKNIVKTKKHCFQIFSKKGLHWELCAQNFKLRNEWICTIKQLLHMNNLEECDKNLPDEDNITYYETHVTQPIILIPEAAPYCNQGWNYQARGQDWECDCKEGKEQSPIDLPKKSKAIRTIVKPIFNYVEVEAKDVLNTRDGQKKSTKYVKLKNEENTIHINHDNFGNIVTLDGAVYKAEKVVFHTPAEHTIAGKRFDMEMQIIHYGQTKGDIAKQVILSFLFVKSPGTYNKFIDDIDFFTLPNIIKGQNERSLESNLYIPKIFYDSTDYDIPFMKDFSFYTYQGSLTSPPCTQNTIVYVASDPIPLGTTAIHLFHEALRMPDIRDSKGNITINMDVPNNNRQIQPRNGRNVFIYEKEPCFDLHKPHHHSKLNGHYEKAVKHTNNYYYVNNDKPSGMPGALVVSKEEALGGYSNWGQMK